MYWLTEAPLAIVRSALRMLPRLEAEEAVATMECVAVGTGSVSDDRSYAIRQGWIKAIDEDAGPARPIPASRDDLQAMGIAYREVPARG